MGYLRHKTLKIKKFISCLTPCLFVKKENIEEEIGMVGAANYEFVIEEGMGGMEGMNCLTLIFSPPVPREGKRKMERKSLRRRIS